DSSVAICMGKTSRCAPNEQILRQGDTSDLTMLRRAALARTRPGFPSEKPAPQEVREGALVIAGGGRLPEIVLERFVELAGGPQSPIVALDIALSDDGPAQSGAVKALERAGAKVVRALTARRCQDVESPDFLDALANAKGVWFGGGRQWRFVDA